MAPGRYTGTMPETQTQLLPLLPLTQGVVFPQMVVTIALETDESKRAGTAAGEAGNRLVLARMRARREKNGPAAETAPQLLGLFGVDGWRRGVVFKVPGDDGLARAELA